VTRQRLDVRAIGPISAGHLCIDLCQGALPALLPFLIVERGLTLAEAATLITAAALGSSIIQPLFGIWTDRFSSPVLMPFGALLTSVGIGAVGLCHSYAMIVVAVGIMGLGVAAFHPEAARIVNAVSLSRRGTGMSYFAVGGNIGFALGPLLTTPIVLAFGLDATPLIAVPGLLAAVVLVRRLGLIRGYLNDAGETGHHHVRERPAQAWIPFSRLVALEVVRSTPFFVLQALVPIYVLRHFHSSKALAGAALTLMLIGGAAGTLIGARCANRFGGRRVMTCTIVPMLILLVMLAHTGQFWFITVLVGVGFLLESPFSTIVLMGQEYLPGRIGLASGITYGFSIGLGGLIGSGLAALAGATGIAFVIGILPAFALLALGMSISLPSPSVAVASAAVRQRMRRERRALAQCECAGAD
jgi:MFS transporter, FSR family, fosmidomycin resistance protein